MDAQAVILKPVDRGCAVVLTNGRELARVTGLAPGGSQSASSAARG